MSRRGRGRLRVQDLPPGVTLAMMITQSVIGVLVGWTITYWVQRAFLAAYAVLRVEPPQVQARHRTRV